MSALPLCDARTDRRLRLRVRGAVQGVGFRPFAYGLATRLALGGFVRNDAEGVLIEVEGAGAEQFLHALAPRAAAARAHRLRSRSPTAARRRRRLRDRGDAGGPALDAHRRRRRDLRGLPRRAVRPGEPLLPLSPRQLHALRAALYADARAALRSRANLDGAVPDVRGLRARLCRPRQSPLPRRADRLPALRPEAQRRNRPRSPPAFAAAGSSRSRGSAAFIWFATRATRRRWRSCAAARRARPSPSP